MAQEFHLKLITQRASGGDPIIRERVVPGPEASIGRAGDSDIVLTDLSIDPRHARMRFTGPGRVSVESLSGAPFTAAGRAVQRADIDTASRPVLQFANYHLAFEPAEDGGAAITVTHEDHDEHLAPSVFSLKSRVFGRRRMSWVFASAVFVVCLLIPMIATGLLSHLQIHPDQQWSSGPLSKAHAFLETDCKACHVHKFVAVRDEACLACHKAGLDDAGKAAVMARSKDGGSPFEPVLVADHAPRDKLRKAMPWPDGIGPKITTAVQRTFNHPTDRCASCHFEHTKPKSTRDEDPKAPLADKPTLVVVQDCQSCHSRLKMRLTDTRLIDTPDWNRHPAFRPLVMTSAGPTPQFQRIALTAAPQEKNGLTFPHKVHLDPLGGVARQAIDLGKARGYGAPLECASCHHRDASGKGFEPVEMTRDCSACHSLAYARVGGELKNLPHGNLQKVAETLNAAYGPGGGAAAFRTAFSRGGACFDCHTYGAPGATTPAGLQMAPVKLTARYMPRGAFDHSVPEHGGPGKSAAGGYKCADCHKAAASEHASDVLIPDIGKCAACHGKTKAQTAAADNADCTTCHSFHAPGEATPKPGHPPLETLRWSEMVARRGSGA